MIAQAPWFALDNLIWLGPAAGILCAVWGFTVGVLGHYFIRHGRGQAWVYGHVYAGLAFGLVLTIAGVIAVLVKQPMPIYAVLLGVGCPFSIGVIVTLFSVRHAYRATELQRMHALEQ